MALTAAPAAAALVEAELRGAVLAEVAVEAVVAARALGGGLRNLTCLTDLALSIFDNGLGPKGARALGEALLKLIGQRTPAQQAALLEVAYEGEYWRPTCASCGTKMVERHSAKNDGSFWGCANYPRCRGKTIPKAYA